MIKYCFITDEEKGTVRLGAGCPDEYYIEIGMEQRDVEQSEKDGQWYLKNKCPHYTEEEIEEMERERIANLTMTALDFITFLRQCGLTLEQIRGYLDNNIELDTQLKYCQNVYCKVAKSVMPITVGDITITAEMVETAFKVKNGEEV